MLAGFRSSGGAWGYSFALSRLESRVDLIESAGLFRLREKAEIQR